jgi:hypothetical protein
VVCAGLVLEALAEMRGGGGVENFIVMVVGWS